MTAAMLANYPDLFAGGAIIAGLPFGAARDAKLMLADKSLSGTGTLEVTPYWITLDGTEVHGVTHTLHYNTRTIWE